MGSLVEIVNVAMLFKIHFTRMFGSCVVIQIYVFGNSGSLKLLEPSGPKQGCLAIILPLKSVSQLNLSTFPFDDDFSTATSGFL